MMTVRERFQATLDFKKPEGGVPAVEWAPYWTEETVVAWKKQGLQNANYPDIWDNFGLDHFYMISAPTILGGPQPSHHGGSLMEDEKGYEKLKEFILKDEAIEVLREKAMNLKEMHDRGEIIIRLWLDGFFWFPRTLFGIENHLYAFYDYPELMKQMNEDLLKFHIKSLRALYDILTPDMVGIAEDMSYNNGPMLSEETFNEFLKPYYEELVKEIKKKDTKVFVDSDGLLHDLIPWLIDAGVQGVYPLERQSMVDVNFIREKYPNFLMLGGFDKMIMKNGEEAMRKEFERIAPVIKSGGYIPSVDHQTPPDCSLENYKLYVKLLKEYTMLYSK